jgi:hypothetical protein
LAKDTKAKQIMVTSNEENYKTSLEGITNDLNGESEKLTLKLMGKTTKG